MTKIATPVEFSSKFLMYRGEIEYNEKWFDRNSKTIREVINPGSTKNSEITTTTTSTEKPSKEKDDSNSSSRLHSCIIILQILALSISAKLLV